MIIMKGKGGMSKSVFSLNNIKCCLRTLNKVNIGELQWWLKQGSYVCRLNMWYHSAVCIIKKKQCMHSVTHARVVNTTIITKSMLIIQVWPLAALQLNYILCKAVTLIWADLYSYMICHIILLCLHDHE